MADENKNMIYDEKIIATVKLDFTELEEWRKEDSDDIPVCSLLSLYTACGIQDSIKDYCKDGEKVTALDNLACNFTTLQKIKSFIESNWMEYSLDIDADNHVFWDTSKYAKNERHYAKKLKSKIQYSINQDFINFCPGIDDELDDDVLVFRVFFKTEKTEEE